MSTEHDVQAHYRHGSLEQAIIAGLAAAGKDPEKLAPDDLMGADEFHIGGAQATAELGIRLGLNSGMHLLDVGSGIGGPARHLAVAHGCRVTGIDLSDEYVAVARSLTRRMGLDERVAFRQGSAMALPFADAEFDGATLLHVGMNIADKKALCGEVYRALRPGGFFAVYDVMRMQPGELVFPVPWSTMPDTSFVETPERYRDALVAAGFTIEAERSRADFAKAFFAELQARLAQAGPQPLGLQIIMGPTAGAKVGNMVRMVNAGMIAPVEILARK